MSYICRLGRAARAVAIKLRFTMGNNLYSKALFCKLTALLASNNFWTNMKQLCQVDTLSHGWHGGRHDDVSLAPFHVGSTKVVFSKKPKT